MDNKEKYINDINKRFNNKVKELLLKQVELFYENKNVKKTKYNIGDDVKLSKGTFIHGIFGELDNFDWIVENGFIGNDFTNKSQSNKIKNSIGMWNIKEDILLREYINQYSGITIGYSIGRGPGSINKYQLIPYHKFDEITEKN